MSTVIFFNLPAHGHTNPTLPLVRELVARGEQVLYYSLEEFRPKIEATGATFRAYRGAPEFDIARLAGNLFRLAAFLMTMTEHYAPVFLDEIRAAQPDYVIHDSMCVWGKYVARVLKVPAVSSVTTFAFGRESGGISRTFRREMLLTLLRSLPDVFKHRRIARRLQQDYGVKNDGLLDAFGNREPLNLVYTSRQFQPNGDAFDDTFKFVGPSIMPRQEATDFPFEMLVEKPVIYISMGTIFNQRADFYQTCFEAFGGGQGRVVLSVGRRVEVATLGDLPPNFIVRDYVPQLDVLQCADLFITHGGMNSVHEGLYYGVPLVAIPQMAEQGAVADRVAEVGAGVRLSNRQVTPALLKAAAARVLGDDSFRQHSQRIGESLRAAGGYRRAADEIFAFKAAHGILG